MARRHGAQVRAAAATDVSEARHLDRGHGGVVAFVHAARSAWLQGVGGEHAESHGQSGFERHLLQSARGFAGNVIEMRRLSANHRAQGDDRVIRVRVRQHLRRQGKLERAGNVETLQSSQRRRFSSASRRRASSFSVIAD